MSGAAEYVWRVSVQAEGRARPAVGPVAVTVRDDEQPTPTTQQPTPTTEAPKKVTGADVQQAGEDLDNGKITEQQYKDIQSRWYCQMGLKRFC